MKKIVFVLLTAAIVFNCSSDEGKPSEDNQLLGKWQLIEQLLDPGDGSGTFQTINSERVIEFFSDGTLKINGELCFMASEVGEEERGTYQITSDHTADTTHDGEIIPNTSDSRSAKVYFDLPLSGHLILWYQCIEPCGQKFQKID